MKAVCSCGYPMEYHPELDSWICKECKASLAREFLEAMEHSIHSGFIIIPNTPNATLLSMSDEE